MSVLAGLQQLEQAATPGPWRNAGTMGAVVSDNPGFVADFEERHGADTLRAYDGALVFESAELRDREFVAALRNAAPALLAVVAEAWKTHRPINGQVAHPDCPTCAALACLAAGEAAE